MNKHRFWYLVRNTIPDALREIRWAWQRVFRGHDERVMWALEDFLAGIIPDIERFCHEELADTATPELNPERHRIFTETLRLITEWRAKEDVFNDESIAAGKLWGYIGAHVGYFWN